MQDSSKKPNLIDAILLSLLCFVLMFVYRQSYEHQTQREQLEHQAEVVDHLDAITAELSAQLDKQYTQTAADSDWEALFESNPELDGSEEILE